MITLCDNVLEEPFLVETEKNLDAWTSCVAGALLKHEYIDVIAKTGFVEVAIVEEQDYHIEDENIPVNVTSITINARKRGN